MQFDDVWTSPAGWQETCSTLNAVLVAGGVHSLYQGCGVGVDMLFSGIIGDYKISAWSVLEEDPDQYRPAGLFYRFVIANMHRAWSWR